MLQFRSGYRQIEEFEELSRIDRVKFDAAYEEIRYRTEQLKQRKEQAEDQLIYYQRRENDENKLERDLKPYEYNVSS